MKKKPMKVFSNMLVVLMLFGLLASMSLLSISDVRAMGIPSETP